MRTLRLGLIDIGGGVSTGADKEPFVIWGSIGKGHFMVMNVGSVPELPPRVFRFGKWGVDKGPFQL